MLRLSINILFLFLSLISLHSQSGLNTFLKPSDSLNKPRRNTVVITESAIGVGTLLALQQLWYSDFNQTSFRVVDDSRDWLQMDKFGHVFSSYQLGRLSANSLNWAGVSKKDQLIYGGTLGLGFLTAVEVMDGFSEEWGFSWSDMAANALGTGIYIGQELLWNEQRITLKYSFSRSSFAQLRPEVLGEGLYEGLLKDYNGQTYWMSINLQSFIKTNFLPTWLNFAIGYSGDGMLSGSPNDPIFSNQNRTRQFLMSLDIDLSRIKTNSNLLRTLFDLFNFIKVPLPTLEFRSNGIIKGHIFYF